MIQSSNDSYRAFVHSPIHGAHFDQRLMEDLYERLAMQPNVETQDLHLQAVDGTIMLKGSVSEPPMKVRIENLVAACPYVENIISCLKIRSDSNHTSD